MAVHIEERHDEPDHHDDPNEPEASWEPLATPIAKRLPSRTVTRPAPTLAAALHPRPIPTRPAPPPPPTAAHRTARPKPAIGPVYDPTDADLATEQGKWKKASEYMSEAGAKTLALMMMDGYEALNAHAVKRILDREGHIFKYQDGQLYHYNETRRVYEEGEAEFNRIVLELGFTLESEYLAVRRLLAQKKGDWVSEIRRVIPAAKMASSVVKDAQRCLWPLVETPPEPKNRRAGQSFPERMNGNLDIINVTNGILHLPSGQLFAHGPEHLTSVQLPFPYDPKATCPSFLGFLASSLPNPDEQALLQEFLGYCLMATPKFEKALILYGPGGTGKSTLIKVIVALVGDENCAALSLDDLDDRFRTAELKDKSVNVCTEFNPNRTINEAKFKSYVSGDPVIGERKFQHPTTYRPFAKFIISANALPKVTDETNAFFRRCMVLKFVQKYSMTPDLEAGEFQADPDLEAKLETEMSGILNWALEGRKRLFERSRFEIPESVQANVDEFRQEQSVVLRFVNDRCHFGKDARVDTPDLYEAFLEWCRLNHEDEVKVGPFGKAICALAGVENGKAHKSRFYMGIALAPPPVPQRRGRSAVIPTPGAKAPRQHPEENPEG
jgi:P4 family phage/plasmid primase-like protien